MSLFETIRLYSATNYFRRTQELESLLHEDQSILESPPQLSFTPEPELGDTNIEHSSPSPPEVSHQTTVQQSLEAPEQEPVFVATLETRKKKKKPSPIIAPEIGHAPTERQPSPPIEISHHISSAPTKRKFIPEEDDQFGCDLDAAEDEFQFRRPSYSPKSQMNSRGDTSQDQSSMKNVEVARGSKTPVLAKRKVLEPSKFHLYLYGHSMHHNVRSIHTDFHQQRVQTPIWALPRKPACLQSRTSHLCRDLCKVTRTKSRPRKKIPPRSLMARL